MKFKILALAFALVFVAAACNKNNDAVNEETNTTTPAANTTTPPANNDTRTAPQPDSTGSVSDKVTIKITASGFEPANVTVKKGATVTFVNDDSRLRWPASGPHPTHTNYPEFDPKAGIAAGAAWSFKFDKVGSWGFHDHLLPSQFGKVTVTE